MKKYGVLYTLTLLIIAGILLAGNAVKTSVPLVEYRLIETCEVEDTILCTGRMESADSEKVFVSVPCIAGEVYVSAGEAVEAGQPLFSLDIGATRQALAASGGSLSSMGLTDQALEKMESEVKAPAAGIVTTLNVVQGELTDTENACAVISSSESLQVAIAISEKSLKKASVGQTVRVSGMAFDKESYQGVLSYIAPSARQQLSGSTMETVVDAVVTLEELDESIRPGLSARARIVTGSKPAALVAPYEDVLQDEEGNEYVFLCQEGKAVKRVVVTGGELSQGYEILEGLQEGDRVISAPEEQRLSDGMRVSGRPAA
ncbi:MAG: HlyD family efflux transporter periplasmic adaptor subunit [Clostridiales bacterium]|nr:HlyD family efflux transporter periplasmic adaptor subunit [Clostridiales bacterium]